jgi:hypothetical protein
MIPCSPYVVTKISEEPSLFSLCVMHGDGGNIKYVSETLVYTQNISLCHNLEHYNMKLSPQERPVSYEGHWYCATHFVNIKTKQNKINSVTLVRKRTLPTERPPLVSELSTNISGYRVSRDQHNESPRPLISVF